MSPSEPRLGELDHVHEAIEEALREGSSEVETTEDTFRQTEDVFRNLPHLLVTSPPGLGESPEFDTPEDSILPDFLREHDWVPVIFSRRADQIVSVWPRHFELG